MRKRKISMDGASASHLIETIHAQIDALEWDSETLNAIAEAFRERGIPVGDVTDKPEFISVTII